ncbi:MAG: DUF2271 domain-containing protein [Phycisphaerales bacterium]|jgi:hypothetical protein|nr:DUF2271 domain-containing protein [Phycisphaerales bacterium]
MDNDTKNSSGSSTRKKILAVILFIGICVGGVIGYLSQRSRPATGVLAISFKINDPLNYPDDEPLQDPQTAVWLEDAQGKYISTAMISDWTSMEGWEETVKLPDGTKVKEMCPKWQEVSGWPANHTKQQIDAVTKATPETGPHTVKVNLAELKLTTGTYRYCVQTSVAPRHTIIATGTITIGSGQVESNAIIVYTPDMHPDAGPVLSDVNASYTP